MFRLAISAFLEIKKITSQSSKKKTKTKNLVSTNWYHQGTE
jgi:hypothetical protein